ncbi:MAG TPA: hypothetical protein VMP01_04970 [Pirellulaceae bacterium]|nr:hypothetical protein [Pirellulaceae bacterium]
MFTRFRATPETEFQPFAVEFEVANTADEVDAAHRDFPADKVRRLKLRGFLKKGAMRLVLPPTAIEQLGVPVRRQAFIRIKDGRREELDQAIGVRVSIQGRSGVFSAVIDPGRTDALIGVMVLEELDFIADCITQSLVPRDPKQPIAEIE